MDQNLRSPGGSILTHTHQNCIEIILGSDGIWQRAPWQPQTSKLSRCGPANEFEALGLLPQLWRKVSCPKPHADFPDSNGTWIHWGRRSQAACRPSGSSQCSIAPLLALLAACPNILSFAHLNQASFRCGNTKWLASLYLPLKQEDTRSSTKKSLKGNPSTRDFLSG